MSVHVESKNLHQPERGLCVYTHIIHLHYLLPVYLSASFKDVTVLMVSPLTAQHTIFHLPPLEF